MQPIKLKRGAKDITGQSFGRLTAIAPIGRDKHQKILWHCECDCGKIATPTTSDLTTGHTTSCGCSRIGATAAPKHGMYGTPVYLSWKSMKARCLDKNHPGYKYWGGRGITICGEWMSFEGFYRDMGDRPDGTTLDRIDNNGNYEKGNCRWASRLVQNRNRRCVKNDAVITGITNLMGGANAA